jgi:hypothetical protein
MKALLKYGAVVTAMLAAAPRALAQGCAMCYTEAAAQSPRARHHLDLAILTLLVPCVSMFAGVLIAAFRRRVHDEAEEGLAAPRPIISVRTQRQAIPPGPAADSV